MKFGNFFKLYILTITDIILHSALAICLVAVMAITTDSRHAMKTPGFLLAKMLSLVEKMEETQTPEPYCYNHCQRGTGEWECCTDPHQQECCLDDDLNDEFCYWSSYC